MTERVPRETPPTPSAAWGAFGVQTALAERYVAWLATAGTERGLIGPREVDRLWGRHVLNSAALAQVVPEDATVCDVGTGAGLPGLVLALARPDLRITLVEPLLRRTTFLGEVVDDLGLEGRVEVVRGRAENLHGQRTFDVVTSRAVAPLGRLLQWSVPLASRSGVVVAMKGERAEDEIAESEQVWRSELGCTDPEVIELESAGEVTRVVRVARDPSRPVSWPTAPTVPPKDSNARSRARKRRQTR